MTTAPTPQPSDATTPPTAAVSPTARRGLIAALRVDRDWHAEAARRTPAGRPECVAAHSGFAAGLDSAIRAAITHAIPGPGDLRSELHTAAARVRHLETLTEDILTVADGWAKAANEGRLHPAYAAAAARLMHLLTPPPTA